MMEEEAAAGETTFFNMQDAEQKSRIGTESEQPREHGERVRKVECSAVPSDRDEALK